MPVGVGVFLCFICGKEMCMCVCACFSLSLCACMRVRVYILYGCRGGGGEKPKATIKKMKKVTTVSEK